MSETPDRLLSVCWTAFSCLLADFATIDEASLLSCKSFYVCLNLSQSFIVDEAVSQENLIDSNIVSALKEEIIVVKDDRLLFCAMEVLVLFPAWLQAADKSLVRSGNSWSCELFSDELHTILLSFHLRSLA